MRKLLLILFVSILSCKNNEPAVEVEDQIVQTDENFDWLTGTWERTNEQEDRETFETWIRKTDVEYQGLGFTLQRGDTIWKENVRLVKSAHSWNFEVTGQGESEPTVFKVTGIEKEAFSSENPENEFPQVIAYSKTSDGMQAVISGNDMEIPFLFEKVD